MYSKAIVVGNLVRDPESKTTSNDNTVTKFTVAVSERKDDKPAFIEVVTWGKLAEMCAKWLTKGRQILAEGSLKQDSWEDKNGNKRSKLYINAFTIKFIGTGKASSTQSAPAPKKEAPAPAPQEDEDPGLPF